jgi:hypothetical protein
MVAIVVGAKGEYSVSGHTAVEQCMHESMLVKEKSQKELELRSDAISMGSIASSRHARKERSSRSFPIQASSDVPVRPRLVAESWIWWMID